ncbi:hypothetical protein ACFY36_08550 [Actinoplanes sp. NPDC000266]
MFAGEVEGGACFGVVGMGAVGGAEVAVSGWVLSASAGEAGIWAADAEPGDWADAVGGV